MQESVIDRFIRVCNDGFKQGWHERNGGNLSYRMTGEDVRANRYLFSNITRHFPLPLNVSSLAGEYFIVSGSGKYMRNVILAPEKNIGIIRISDDGNGYDILWGLEESAKPTSELPTHLLNHIARMEVTDGKCRVIYHAHPAAVTALSYAIENDSRALTRILWQSETECAVVFPDGVGIVDWMVPGGIEIAYKTAELIKKYSAVVWSFHGIFCSGADFDETFGLLHTIEKAADIYIKASSLGIKRTITDENLKRLGEAFGVKLNPEFLD